MTREYDYSPEEEVPFVYTDDGTPVVTLAPVVPIRPDPSACIDTLREKRQAVLDCQKLVDVDERLLEESRAALLAAKNELAVATHTLLFSLGVD